MGTTVATNALLERKGEPVVLVTTQGLGEQLRLGYQNRPRLFDRRIVLPELCTAGDRGARAGARRRHRRGAARQRAPRRRARRRARNLRAPAPSSSRTATATRRTSEPAALAEAAGFTQVSVSHRVSPLMKMVSRGDTTVVDAYLTPILRRYIDRVAAAFEGDMTALMFMQSSGGLTGAGRFQGKDAILSGPAGGVVGAVRTARSPARTGSSASTWAAPRPTSRHFAGEFERVLEHRDRRRPRHRADDDDPHRGGGRRLDPRLRRRPHARRPRERRRRSRPRLLRPRRPGRGHRRQRRPRPGAPRVLPGDLRPRRRRAARRRRAPASALADLADRIGRPTEEVAEGFLRIAVENMANAIKKISVQRGYDVSGYASPSSAAPGRKPPAPSPTPSA